MAESTLVKRLVIKPGYRLLAMHAPDGYTARLHPLPAGARVETLPDGQFDHVQLFVRSKADIDTHAPTAMAALKPGGVLWFAYPKKSSGVKTDINRDMGWETVRNAGFEAVTQIAIDDTWSALRFRPLSEIKVMIRKRA